MSFDNAMFGIAALGEGESPEELCRQLTNESGADGPGIFGLSELDTIDVSFGDDDCAVRFGRTWAADEFDIVLTALAEDDGPTVRRTDDGGWSFELDLGPISDELSEEQFSEDDVAQATAFGFEFPTLAISVTLPGDAVEHNADSVRQSTYSWEIDFLTADELPENLYVETAPGGGLGPEAIGAIVAGVGLALAALVTLRRRREAQAIESSASDAETTTAKADDATEITDGAAVLDGGTDADAADDTPDSDNGEDGTPSRTTDT